MPKSRSGIECPESAAAASTSTKNRVPTSSRSGTECPRQRQQHQSQRHRVPHSSGTIAQEPQQQQHKAAATTLSGPAHLVGQRKQAITGGLAARRKQTRPDATGATRARKAASICPPSGPTKERPSVSQACGKAQQAKPHPGWAEPARPKESTHLVTPRWQTQLAKIPPEESRRQQSKDIS